MILEKNENIYNILNMRYIILKPCKIMHYKITHLLDWNYHITSVMRTQGSNLWNSTTIGAFYTSLVSFLSR